MKLKLLALSVGLAVTVAAIYFLTGIAGTHEEKRNIVLESSPITSVSYADSFTFAPQIGHFGSVNSLVITPDRKFIVSGSRDGTIKVWRMSDGSLVRTLEGHSGHVYSVAISPYGEFIVSGSRDGTIKVWRMRDGSLVRTLKGHSEPVYSVAISPDGKFIVSGGDDSTIKVWRMRDGSLVRTLEGHSDWVLSVAISPDGKFIVSGSDDETIKVWRIRDGKLVRTLEGYSGPVLSVAISPDGEFIVSGSFGSTIKVWRMRDGELLATLAATSDGDWVAGAPNGLWDGKSRSGSWPGVLRFEGTLKACPGDPECDRLHYPGLLAYIWEHGELPPVPTVGQPPTTVVQGSERRQVPSTTAMMPELWVLAIGVSKYKHREISLQYADHDAEQFARFMKSQEGKLFRKVHVRTLTNAKATRKNILNAMIRFLGQASSEDVVIVFLSGHGLKYELTGRYYFITYETDPEDVLATALSMDDIDAACNIVKRNVNKFMIYLDTCHSGGMEIGKAIEVGADVTRAFKEAEGIFILASAKEGEYSKEDRGYKLPYERKEHGAFTYVILKGLEGEADKNGDGIITVMELSNYVSDYVPKITDGLQHPYLRGEGTDMPIYRLR